MELNRLTQDLYAEGYTREQHPNFVYWSNWQNFGYRWEALLKFTWGIVTSGGGSPQGMPPMAGSVTVRRTTILCFSVHTKKRPAHIFRRDFRAPSARAAAQAGSMIMSAAPRKSKRSGRERYTGSIWSSPAGPAVPVLWEAMAIRAGAWKSGMMWNSASGAAVRTRFA